MAPEPVPRPRTPADEPAPGGTARTTGTTGTTGTRPGPRPRTSTAKPEQQEPEQKAESEPRTDTDRSPALSARLARLLAPLRHPVAASMLLAAVLHLLWFWFVASAGGDLAAQDAWAEFVSRHPDSAYNLAWYGGVHPFSYSVLSPYLMAAVGVRSTLITAGVLCSGLLALILRRVLRRPMVPALWGAFSITCNAASGRVTFALGVLFGLGAIAVVWAWPPGWWRAGGAWRYARGVAAALPAALATMSSPVAGLFLEVVAAALFLDKRRQAAYSLAVAPPVVVAVSAVLFPFEGVQPIPWWSVVFPLAVAVPCFRLVPRSWRTVRLGAVVYGLGVVLTWLIPSQVGSNVERLGLLFGGVALFAAVPSVVRGDWRSRRGVAMVCALVVATGWQIVKPTFDVVATTPDSSWAREIGPLTQQLRKVDAERGRVEVVPVRSHREASALSPYVNLARGWNRQADTDRNPLFYENGGLTPSRYHDWLRRWAVRYVVLPADNPDPAGIGEARIVRGGQPYLRQIWSDAHWRLYRVTDPAPLAEPPAHVQHAGSDGVTVRVPRRGSVAVRIPWSPWLSLVDARGRPIGSADRAAQARNGCLREARTTVDAPPPKGEDEPVVDNWTVLEAPHAGTYRLAAPYRMPRATPCLGGDEKGSP